jgi:DUF1009 family protein
MLAIIAGQGDLPQKIIEARLQRNQPIVVIAFEGQTPPELIQKLPTNIPFMWAKFGQIAPILSFFKQHNVTEITMIGGMTRPAIRDLSVDWTGAKWIKILGMNALKGDDSLLSAIVELLEKEGYRVVPAHVHLSNLFMPRGIHTQRTPTPIDINDINQGIALLNTLSPLDIGQAAVVRNGIVLGIETIEGTAQLLAHVANHTKQTRQNQEHSQSGVLIKMPKIGQSKKVDLPTIGISTIHQAVDAGLSGIAIESSGVQVIDSEQVIQMANNRHIFIKCF